LPLAMAGMMQQGWGNQQGWNQNQQQGWNNNQQQGWNNNQQGWSVQMQGQMTQGGNGGNQQQQVQTNSNQWWGMETEEDYNAYVRWCEERRMAIAEQEEQQNMLMQITRHAEEKKHAAAQEHAMKEQKMKRETMVAQWRMWQATLSQADQFDGLMDKYGEMKIHYMFSLTMDFLKFCRCSDYTGHLQRYLIHSGQTYEPGMTDAFNLDQLEGIDTSNVDAVAQRLALLGEGDQIKAFFGGVINSMCDSVKSYVNQVEAWETQYNFMGI